MITRMRVSPFGSLLVGIVVFPFGSVSGGKLGSDKGFSVDAQAALKDDCGND